MKNRTRFAVSILLIFAFVANALPCGPAYLTPLFEYAHAPENPYENFAAGRIGILKPTYNRSVLFAAYRYLNGGGFSAGEQKALVEVWKAEFDNQDFRMDDEIGEAVKAWVEKRKEVVGKEEKVPEIYVERNYGGYDFFPNCTQNAFETATGTLSDRVTSYGADDKDVKEWVATQDKVFANCASGKQIPEAIDTTKPEWLQKDRAYQIGAAEFYSLDYEAAKHRFLEIALDDSSPWKETADYMVGRTLIRQASLTKDDARADLYYTEAEQNLTLTASRGNRFSDSAARLLGLIKFRLRPKERVRELAHNLSFGGNEEFRQNLIDYNWLLDKFEKEELEKQEKRKEAEKARLDPNSNISSPASENSNTGAAIAETPHDEGDLLINLYIEPKSFSFYVKPDASDSEVIAEAEKVVGQPLTEDQKKQVRENKQAAYSSRFSENRREEYPGRYYGEEETSLSILPSFLRDDDLTDWLFTYQIEDTEAYLYALSKYKQTSADIWLVTAISKADKNSTDLGRLMEAGGKTSRTDPGYLTIAYNMARIYLEQGKTAEARKLLDDVLDSASEMPVSARNQFLKLRLKLADTMEDYIKFSLRRPFAFDFDGQRGTIDDFIATQKSWYDPTDEPDKTREEYDRDVEKNWKTEKLWQDREMFDSDTIEAINTHFPLSLLLQMEKSPSLPEHLRDKFSIPILTRALMLGDMATLGKIAPDVIRDYPELEKQLTAVLTAKTPAAIQNASLYMILKNPMFSPYIEDGIGKTDNELNMWDGNDWWCTPYDTEFDEASGSEVPRKVAKPAFLTAVQSQTAQAERKKIKDFGDAPAYLGNKVLQWAKRSPLDKRVPESLYIVYEANGWTKYGCGNNEDMKNEVGDILKRRYPDSEWTQKVIEEEKPQQ